MDGIKKNFLHGLRALPKEIMSFVAVFFSFLLKSTIVISDKS